MIGLFLLFYMFLFILLIKKKLAVYNYECVVLDYNLINKEKKKIYPHIGDVSDFVVITALVRKVSRR